MVGTLVEGMGEMGLVVIVIVLVVGNSEALVVINVGVGRRKRRGGNRRVNIFGVSRM